MTTTATTQTPRRVAGTVLALVGRDIPLLLSALWEAKLWQDSLVDAHTLGPGNQTRWLTARANEARRMSRRYERLHDRIHKANAGREGTGNP